MKRVLDAAVTLVNGSIFVLAALADGISNALAALLDRTITGGGLATGGGDLTASRVITVPKASGVDVTAGTDDLKAITPLALATAMGARSMGVPGYVSLFGFIFQWGTFSVAANSTISPNFPTTFPNACFHADCNGGRNDFGAQDNNPYVQSASASGLTIFNSTDTGPITGTWFAIGR